MRFWLVASLSAYLKVDTDGADQPEEIGLPLEPFSFLSWEIDPKLLTIPFLALEVSQQAHDRLRAFLEQQVAQQKPQLTLIVFQGHTGF